MTKPLSEIIKNIPNFDPYADADDFYFDSKTAKRAIDFIEEGCVHVKGRWANKPLLLDNWQKAIVANLFGWKHKETKLRRFRELFVFVPRKNGKTILAAAIAIVGLFIDNEPGAEIYTCGFEKDQASLSWDMAKQMIQRKKGLRKRCKILNSTRLISKPDGSVFKPLSHESESKHGMSPHIAVFDEIHTYRNEDLIETIETGCGAREQPILCYITTSDFDRENSPCNARHDYAKKVQNDPKFDLSFLPVVYELNADEDWTDPKLWKKANPGLGTSISLDFLMSQCKKAQNRPSYTNTFKRLYLNIRTSQDIVWLKQSDWQKGYKPEITIADLIGLPCYGGLDLASTRDLCALSYWFPDVNTMLCRCWAPVKKANERSEKNRGSYLQWAEQGHLTLTPGNVADYNIIRETVLQDAELFNIQSIGVDRWNSTHLITQLKEDGLDVIPFGQGYGSMSSPTKEFERLVLSGDFNHMNNPVLNWCLGNVKLSEDPAGNIKPDKKKSSDKIDLTVSSIMAIGMHTINPESSGSVYEEEGLFVL